jgi:sn-glycerol 3-phosphate transport system ATP-binding protein
MTTVSLKGVSKSFDNQSVLHDIHLHINKGEFVAVVGPSGCGKSTLLRLIAGLDTVSKGNILINNRCVNKIPAASRDMAMVFQNYALYPHMTVFDNMAYALKIRGMKKKNIQQRVAEVAELLQLKDFLARKPLSLSGGQRQRVAMGRAIVRSPAVFLFDEPLSNLDAQLRTEMRYEIKKLHKKLGTTFLYVTHDQTEAMTMADRIVILKDGRIEQEGTPREIYQYPSSAFVAGFIGQYPINFIPGKMDLEEQTLRLETGTILPLPMLETNRSSGDSVLLGIRPEHFRVTAESTALSIPVNIELIDDLGSDQQLQVTMVGSDRRFTVRVSGDVMITNRTMNIEIDLEKAHLFCQPTGKRIGGWNESQ